MFAKRFAPLTLVVAFAACIQTSASETDHAPAELICIGNPEPKPAVVFDLDRTTSIQAGGITANADGWTVAVIMGTYSPDDGPSLKDGKLRIFREAHGELPSAILDARKHPINGPLPVQLSNGGLGILWGEAAPRKWFSRDQEWPRDQSTELWYSEWNGAWQTPRLLVDSNLRVDLIGAYTIAQWPSDGIGLLTIRDEYVLERSIMFGTVEGPLQPIPIDRNLIPLAATMLVSDDGVINVALQAAHRDHINERAHAFYLLTSADHGATWSLPAYISRFRGVATNVRLLSDRNGHVHLTWSADGQSMRHLVRRAHEAQWTEVYVPREESQHLVSLAGRAGINRCGDLAIVREVLGSETDTQIQTLVWTEGIWVADSARFAGYRGFALFDGWGIDNTWYVGWTGAQVSPEQERPKSLSVMIATP